MQSNAAVGGSIWSPLQVTFGNFVLSMSDHPPPTTTTQNTPHLAPQMVPKEKHPVTQMDVCF